MDNKQNQQSDLRFRRNSANQMVLQIRVYRVRNRRIKLTPPLIGFVDKEISAKPIWMDATMTDLERIDLRMIEETLPLINAAVKDDDAIRAVRLRASFTGRLILQVRRQVIKRSIYGPHRVDKWFDARVEDLTPRVP